MSNSPKRPRNAGLRVIGFIKFLKGVLLLVVGLGVFGLINQNLAEVVRTFATRLRIDPENLWVRRLVESVANIQPRQLRKWGWITLFFSADLLCEGVGLWLNQNWAKWLAMVAATAFIPEEIYYLARKFSWELTGVLAFNLVVAVYLAQHVWYTKKAGRAGG